MKNELHSLSPAAQAVMDAYIAEDRAGRLAVAAALRAAAKALTYTDDFGDDFVDPQDLKILASELDAI